ncbi:Kinetochore protein NDC80 [Glycine soja]
MHLFETLKFLLTLLNFPSSKLEDNLPLFLKCLNYLFKLNKSTLRSPVPHLWPTFLTLIHCLDHITKFHIHLSSSPKQNNSFYQYAINNYMHFIHNEDDTVEDLDRNIKDKLHYIKDALEKEKVVQEDGMKNFHKKIEDEELLSWIEQSARVLVEKEK